MSTTRTAVSDVDATAPVSTKDALKSQFQVLFATLRDNLDGMTQEDSVAQPHPGGNCANWILGHLTNVQNQLMQLVGEDPVWESPQLERAGTEPITSAESAIDFDLMRDRFLGSAERLMAALERLTDDDLAQDGIPHPFGGTTTRGALLALLSFHQAYHAGQLGLSRRLAGHPGAVGAPGQDGH